MEGESPSDSQYSLESSQVTSQYDSPEIVSTKQVINDSTTSTKESRTQAIMVERREPADVLMSDGGQEVVQARGIINDLLQQDTTDESEDIVKTNDVLAERPTPEMNDKMEFQLHFEKDVSQKENGHSTDETKAVGMKRHQSSRTVSIFLQSVVVVVVFFLRFLEIRIFIE